MMTTETPSHDRPLLSVLMPIYNERDNYERAIEAVLKVTFPGDIEIVIVDDGSQDGTREALSAAKLPPNVRLILHERNQGKGAAVRTALAAARGQFSAIFDADLEYDPGDLVGLLAPLMRREANASYGVRAFSGYTSHSYLYVLGNRGVTFICNVLYNVYVQDLMTCHKMIRTDLFKSLPLRENGFTIEAEITARLVQRGERIWEIPAHYRARAHSEGKKLTWRDGFRVVGTLIRCRLAPG